jgi:YD repeat-containing protein
LSCALCQIEIGGPLVGVRVWSRDKISVAKAQRTQSTNENSVIRAHDGRAEGENGDILVFQRWPAHDNQTLALADDGSQTVMTGPQRDGLLFHAHDNRTLVEADDGGQTVMADDDVGNLLSLTGPEGNETVWVYDALDRVIEETTELADALYFEAHLLRVAETH